ncbi:MAG TPA: hypothetical protein VK891_06315 [Euzebyales bacterium]|nr:hypothetical protein [Euzebyales bacterium]
MRNGVQGVYGASWRRHGDRRLRAARIARMLRPVVHVIGGLVSTELTVPYRGRWYRPDVGVVLTADAPLDGVLERAPALVVRLGEPLSAAAWLQAGADTVWAVEGGTVWELSPGRRRVLTPDQWLTHPREVALRLPAREMVGEPTARARVEA